MENCGKCDSASQIIIILIDKEWPNSANATLIAFWSAIYNKVKIYI